MAIINCPECNGQISDTCKNCIHCGAEIVICPECKSVQVEGAEACSKCGYSFKKPEPVNTKSTDEEEKSRKITAMQFVEAFGKVISSSGSAKAAKVFEILFFISLVVTLIVCMLLNSATTSAETETLLVALLFCAGVYFPFFYHLFTIFICTRQRNNIVYAQSFAKSTGKSLNQIIDNTLNIEYSTKNSGYIKKQTEGMGWILDSKLSNFTWSFRRAINVRLIVFIILNYIVSSCCVWLIMYQCLYFMGETVGDLLLFAPGKGILIALMVVSYIAMIIYNIIMSSYSKKRRREWIVKNYPKHVEVYDKYLSGKKVK